MTRTRPPSRRRYSTAILFATLRFHFVISFATVSSGSSPDFFWSDPEFLFPFRSRLVAAAQRSRQLRSWKPFLPFLGGCAALAQRTRVKGLVTAPNHPVSNPFGRASRNPWRLASICSSSN